MRSESSVAAQMIDRLPLSETNSSRMSEAPENNKSILLTIIAPKDRRTLA